MKKMFALALTCVLALSMVCCLAGRSHAAFQTAVVDEIEGSYILFKVTGFDPKAALPEPALVDLMQNSFQQLGVEHLQYVIYDEDKRPGDGVRAWGEFRKDGTAVTVFGELRGDRAPLQGKFIENLLGYRLDPESLYAAYTADAAAAGKAFTGQKLVMEAAVEQLGKDAAGNPCFTVPAGKNGQGGIQISLAESDPFLSKGIEGTKIGVRVTPKGFDGRLILADGVVISDGKHCLVDGKALPAKEVFGE